MRLTDLFLALPILPLLLVVVLLLGELEGDVVKPRDLHRGEHHPDSRNGCKLLAWFVVRCSPSSSEFVVAAHSIGTRKRNISSCGISPPT